MEKSDVMSEQKVLQLRSEEQRVKVPSVANSMLQSQCELHSARSELLPFNEAWPEALVKMRKQHEIVRGRLLKSFFMPDTYAI